MTRRKRLSTRERQPAELLAMMEEECWTLRCITLPNAGDADVAWEVISYHMSAPQERTLAIASSPLAALQKAAGE